MKAIATEKTIEVFNDFNELSGSYVVKTEKEAEDRARVVSEAVSWEGTPFHDCVGIKGTGCDCGHFPYHVFHGLGLIPEFEIPHYTSQFLLHSSKEDFLGIVETYAHRIDGPPLPGDLKMWKFGKCFSHSAIVLSWPLIIHASVTDHGIIRADAEGSSRLKYFARWEGPNGRRRPALTFRLNIWGDA